MSEDNDGQRWLDSRPDIQQAISDFDQATAIRVPRRVRSGPDAQTREEYVRKLQERP